MPRSGIRRNMRDPQRWVYIADRTPALLPRRRMDAFIFRHALTSSLALSRRPPRPEADIEALARCSILAMSSNAICFLAATRPFRQRRPVSDIAAESTATDNLDEYEPLALMWSLDRSELR